MAPNPLSFELKAGTQPVRGLRLIKRIGRGGFGEVWEAQNDATENHVALKFLDTKHQAYSSLVINEIRLLIQLRQLQHQNLLQFYDVTADKNMIILSMELAEGSLNDLHYIYRTDRKTHMPPDVLLNLMGQAAEGLDFIGSIKTTSNTLNAQGMQHCDIKPSNLLLIGNVLKVADFGLSGPQLWNARGSAFGTPPYAPPELYEGKACTTTDQYSLAVTYCELRSGFFPFPIPPPGTPPSTTPDLTILPLAERPVVAKALSRQWLNRYATCREFVQALAGVLDPKGLALTCSARSSIFRRFRK
jgi:serine/threonine protein kinase